MSELNNYLDAIKLEKDTKLLPENIREGVKVLGITGTLEELNTFDATATVDDVINPKTFYKNGEKLMGNIQATWEIIATSMNASQLTENTNYYIYDIYEKYHLVLLRKCSY